MLPHSVLLIRIRSVFLADWYWTRSSGDHFKSTSVVRRPRRGIATVTVTVPRVTARGKWHRDSGTMSLRAADCFPSLSLVLLPVIGNRGEIIYFLKFCNCMTSLCIIWYSLIHVWGNLSLSVWAAWNVIFTTVVPLYQTTRKYQTVGQVFQVVSNFFISSISHHYWKVCSF